MSEKSKDVNIVQQNAVRPPPLELGINVEKPKFPQYAVYSKRLESFDEWPEHIPVKKEDLVEAGLVYTGVGDSVRCYFCGGGLRNWVREDVPMEEHAKWYPKCPHILLVKGQGYVEQLIRGEKPEEDGPQTQFDGTAKSDPEVLESVPALSCIQMGFSKEMVKKAINIYKNKNGDNTFKATDLAEIILDLEDQVDDSACENKDVEDCKGNMNGTEDNHKPDEADALIEPIENLLEENHRLKESQSCKICFDKRADVIFLPCGHIVTCPQCAPSLIKCPICRKTINGHVKAFFALKC